MCSGLVCSSNDDIDFDDIDSDIVTFFIDMGLVTIDLNYINLDDDNFSEDNPQTIDFIKFIAWCNRYMQRKACKKDKRNINAYNMAYTKYDKR